MRTSHARNLNEIEFALGELVAEFDADALACCEAPAMWKTATRVRRLAESLEILLARRVEESGVWKRKGFQSAAAYLAADAGTTVTAARWLLETSKRVAEQPKTEQAVRSGELSATKASLVAGAIEVSPESAEELLELAKSAPVAKVKEASLRTKAAVNVDETYAR